MSSNGEVCFSASEVPCERGAWSGKLFRESYTHAIALLALVLLLTACQHGRYIRIELQRQDGRLENEQHAKLLECFLTTASEFKMDVAPPRIGVGTFEFDQLASYRSSITGFSMNYLVRDDVCYVVFRQGSINADLSVAISASERLRMEMDKRGFVSRLRLDQDGYVYTTYIN